MTTALLQKALDALELCNAEQFSEGIEAMADLQAAIAQPEQAAAVQPLTDAPVLMDAMSNTKRKKLLSQMRSCGGRPTKKYSEDGERLIVSAEDLERFISMRSSPAITPTQAKQLASDWHGEAGGELLPQLTENELAGLMNERDVQPALQPLTEFQRMQIIGNEFPLALVQPIVIQKIDSVCLAIEAAHNVKAHPIPAGKALNCIWTEQDDDDMPGTYASACGEMWSFIDGGVVENNVRFCHGCGKPVEVHNITKD